MSDNAVSSKTRRRVGVVSKDGDLRFGPLSVSWLITGGRLEPDAEVPLLAGCLECDALLPLLGGLLDSAPFLASPAMC